jgi:hypothetical protein
LIFSSRVKKTGGQRSCPPLTQQTTSVLTSYRKPALEAETEIKKRVMAGFAITLAPWDQRDYII